MKGPRERIDYSGVAVPKPTRAERAARRLASRTPLPRRNPERMAERAAVRVGPQAEACRKLPCAACGHTPTADRPNEAHHEPPDSTDEFTVPLCRDCHRRRHTVGEVTFWNDLQLEPADVQQAVRDYMHSPTARMRPCDDPALVPACMARPEVAEGLVLAFRSGGGPAPEASAS